MDPADFNLIGALEINEIFKRDNILVKRFQYGYLLNINGEEFDFEFVGNLLDFLEEIMEK